MSTCGHFVQSGRDRGLPATPSRAAVVAWVGLSAAVAGYVTLLVTKPGGEDTVVRVSDLAMTAAALAAAVASARAGRRHLAGMAAFWWLLAAACAAWAIGEATWTWYEVLLGMPVPYPSWADVGYLAGTPLAVAAFLCHPAARHHTGRRSIPLLDAFAVATATLLVSWIAVLGPLVQQTGGMNFGDLVAVAYPFGDVVILVLVVLALRGLPQGNRAAAVLLLAGLTVMAVTDSAYTYLAQNDAYASGDLIDAGWFAAYLAIGAAALVAHEPASADTDTTRRSMLRLAPFVPVLTGLAVVAVEVPRGLQLSPAEWAMTLVLTVLVIARQTLLVVRRRSAARRARLPRPAGPAAPSPAAPVRATFPGADATSDHRAELQVLALQIAAAGRPTAQERVSRVSTSLATALGVTAGALALWDLSLLLNGLA